MPKAEIINEIQSEAGLKNKSDAEKALDAIGIIIGTYLASGERIGIPHLGIFHVKERKARTGRNPRTGETITIPAKKVVVFKATKKLVEKLNA